MTAPPLPAEPPIDWPYYGIGPGAALRRGFAKYATFSGRASRSEYWWWTLMYLVITVVLAVLTFTIGMDWRTSTGYGQVESAGSLNGLGLVLLIVWILWLLGTIIPQIAVTVRRLHDAGVSGWFYLFQVFGLGIVVLILCVLPTSVAAAKYGPPFPAGYLPPSPGGYPPAAGYPAGPPPPA